MIENYQFGQITINGQTYDYDIYIVQNGEIKKWWREESHLIDKEDINLALSDKPKILIIGTGAYGVAKVSDQAKNLTQKNGVELIILPTPQAVEKYNQLKKDGQIITAYLHLTC